MYGRAETSPHDIRRTAGGGSIRRRGLGSAARGGDDLDRGHCGSRRCGREHGARRGQPPRAPPGSNEYDELPPGHLHCKHNLESRAGSSRGAASPGGRRAASAVPDSAGSDRLARGHLVCPQPGSPNPLRYHISTAAAAARSFERDQSH